MYPKLIIDLNKLNHNIKYLIKLTSGANVHLTAITKMHLANRRIVALLNSFDEIKHFGDSRIQNLKKYPPTTKKKILIRIPMKCEVLDVVRHSDISFNSEMATILLLDAAAKSENIVHQVVLMVDLGDLREGYFNQSELLDAVAQIKELAHIELYGIAVNLMCYGGIIPTQTHFEEMAKLARAVESVNGKALQMVSGGNSSGLYLLEDGIEIPVNDLRIGDGMFTGETSYGQQFEQMYRDVLEIWGQIIEVKVKPSYPIGEIGVDAFGAVPTFLDRGERLRVIVALGRQDITVDGVFPKDGKMEILGASSDHLIIDVTDCEKCYQVGDVIGFHLHYGAALQAFTSEFVAKEYIEIKGAKKDEYKTTSK